MNQMNVLALPAGGFAVAKGANSAHEFAPYLAAFTTLDEALQFVRQRMDGSVKQCMSASELAAHHLAAQQSQARTATSNS